MPPSTEIVYNHINGEEANTILLERIQALFTNVREFKRTNTLDRVRMEVNIRFEIEGRTPPSFRIQDDFTIKMERKETVGELIEEEVELTDEISTNPKDDFAQSPDELREEHGLPVMTPVRGPMGIEDKPVIREGRKWAAFVTQDKGSAMRGERDESTVVNTGKGQGKPDEPTLQSDFKEFVRGRE